MSVPESNTEAVPSTDAAAPPITPATPVASAAPAEAPAAPDATVGKGNNLILPRDAFNARLKAATEKGKRAQAAEMAEKLKAAGFSSFDDMLAAVAAAKAATTAKPAALESQSTKGSPDKRLAKEIERERLAREQERKARVKAERSHKELEAEFHALQAEKAIREVAIMAGVKDVDYAVALLQRSIQGKTAEELKSFDEGKFFEELREKQPYLFGETVRPATTGTGGKEPPAPRPGTVHQSSAANGQADVKKMDRQQFEAHLQKLGLRPPSHIV